ncbi:MAG: hypothetical protein AAB590_01470 [Patescibacteria group bacterium]
MQNLKKGNGSIWAIIVIVIVLLLGAYYIWKSSTNSPSYNSENEAVETEIPSDESLTEAESNQNNQNNSDDLPSIETDLNATSYQEL